MKTSCPLPYREGEVITLAHGSGGRLSGELFSELILPSFGGDAALAEAADAAILARPEGRIALSTDAFVVTPIRFPGGDIGDLAVNGTVNDLAVVGARPAYLSVSLILEEGLPLAELAEILASMARAATRAGVRIVTGDTKVVARGQADRIFISTTGVGHVPEGVQLGRERVRPGQQILISGSLGDHGIAILDARGELGLRADVESDTAPLHVLCGRLVADIPSLSFMRDPTRGGVSATLNELVDGAAFGVELDERALPIRPRVRAACELLGLDPLYVANEGKLVAIVDETEAGHALAAIREQAGGSEAAIIGRVVDEPRGMVLARTAVGGTRVVDHLDGEQLPRIC